MLGFVSIFNLARLSSSFAESSLHRNDLHDAPLSPCCLLSQRVLWPKKTLELFLCEIEFLFEF